MVVDGSNIGRGAADRGQLPKLPELVRKQLPELLRQHNR
jgi:hypothetical protein